MVAIIMYIKIRLRVIKVPAKTRYFDTSWGSYFFIRIMKIPTRENIVKSTSK